MNTKWTKIFSLLLLLLITILFYSRMSNTEFIQDDAFITLRYVENFLDGKGLVFNDGEKVEGYTNFLWLLLIAKLKYISNLVSFEVTLVTLTQLLSIIFSFIVLIYTFLFTKSLMKRYLPESGNSIYRNIYSLIPAFLLSQSTPMIYWGVSGMETSLFVLLTMVSLHRFLTGNNETADPVFVIVSVLNSLTRPEGFLIFLLIMSFSVMRKIPYSPTDKKLLSRLINSKSGKVILLYSFPVLIYLIFRITYYGYLFPNTFYAKTGFTGEYLSRGVDYVVSGIGNTFFYGILLILPALNFLKQNLSSVTKFYLYFIFMHFVFIALIGGDVLPVDRFILPVIPVVFIFATITLYRIGGTIRNGFLKNTLMILFIMFLLLTGILNFKRNKTEMETKRSYEVGLVRKMSVYAEWLKKVEYERGTKPGGIAVALSTIGALSFYSGATIIDIVGLTDRYIAHNPLEVKGIDDELPVLWKERRYNAEYVLKRKPDYIIFPAGAKPTAFAECALFVQPGFYTNYYVQLFYSGEMNQLLPVFTRRDTPLLIDNSVCNVKFVKPYIEAYTLFLEMVENRNFELAKQVLDKCDEAELLCPVRISDLDAVRGLTFYHSGDLGNSLRLFESSVSKDPLNIIARFYMMRIYGIRGNEKLFLEQKRIINKYSKDAVPASYIDN
ncbi:MAG TPA: hypothetical protein PLZ15_08860 [Melioribacteraceae bacterium]|nr:hypothetical protein [Melioribacteraceae bacterium]